MPDGKRLLKKFSNSYFSGGKNYGTGAYMFQKKIVEKYLSQLDKELLEQKYDLFCSIFKNETKIANIRTVKEEQYHEGFIHDVL